MTATRGLGRVFARRQGAAPPPGEPDRRPVYWSIEFWHNGKQYREASGSTNKADAVRLLKKRVAEVGAGSYIAKAQRLTFDDAARMVENDYTANGRRTLNSVKRCIEHLRGFFGGEARLADITPDRGDAYIAARLEAKAANATIRKEVSALSRMFVLAHKAGKVAVRPSFTRLRLANTRTLAFSDDELGKLLDVLRHGRPATAMDPEVKPQPDLVPVVVFAATTGWRVKSDILPLRWSAIDFEAGVVTRTGRGTSKAAHSIVFPFGVVPELAALLQQQRARTTALERQTSTVIPTVFHRRGAPIKTIHKAWAAATRRAGLAGRWPHDLRRAAARRLRSLGLSDRDLSELIGWDTIEMVSRYLGRDPGGVAERLKQRLAEAEQSSRTRPALLASGSEDR
jgi:integrase